MEVHHSENPDVVWALDINDAEGKFPGEMPPGGFADEAEGAGRLAGLGNQPVDDGVETLAQSVVDPCIVRRCGVELLQRLTMEGIGFHSPTVLRTRAMASSPGTSTDLSFSISFRRRMASSPHAFSILGSIFLAVSAIN